MNREELDTLWFQAMRQSIEEGEDFIRYHFAALVAAAEREACAKVCEKQIKSYMSKQYTTDPLGGFRERFAAEQCAAAIRARGET
jgi:hypothetical protein